MRYPESTDEQTGETIPAADYIFTRAKAPEYGTESYGTFETDEKLIASWTIAERTLSYFANELHYTETVTFLESGVIVIHYLSEDLVLDRSMYYSYTAADGTLTFSLVTDKETQYQAQYTFDADGNLQFSNDETASSIFADAFFSDVTYYLKKLDASRDAAFISYLTNLGYNSSFTVSSGKLTDATIHFSSNDKKPVNNTVALNDASFSGMSLTLHANNTQNSNAAGGIAKDGAAVTLSSSVTSFTVSLDGDIVMGDATNEKFVKISGSKITVDPSVSAGETAIIGSANANGTYRTMTFINGGDGTYTVTYNTANTISLFDSTFCLNGSWGTDMLRKTDNSDVVMLTKELPVGTYTFTVTNLATEKSYGKNDTVIEDSTNRIVLVNAADACVLNATGGTYEFKYEISTNRLSVYAANETVKGDCNGDGRFDVADVVLLQKWLLAVPNTHFADWKAANFYEDDRLDVFDLCLMKWELSNNLSDLYQ